MDFLSYMSNDNDFISKQFSFKISYNWIEQEEGGGKGSTEVKMRLCQREDFENVNATHIWDLKT